VVEGGRVRRYVLICFYCIIHSEVPDVSSDILIVDKKNDLNIYKERNQGSGESSCCGTAEKEETASISSCCAPAASCPTTCAEKPGLDKADLAKRVANIDFNEWVSKCFLFSKDRSPQSNLLYRLIQHLCCQTNFEHLSMNMAQSRFIKSYDSLSSIRLTQMEERCIYLAA
jgi:hypothetical protein